MARGASDARAGGRPGRRSGLLGSLAMMRRIPLDQAALGADGQQALAHGAAGPGGRSESRPDQGSHPRRRWRPPRITRPARSSPALPTVAPLPGTPGWGPPRPLSSRWSQTAPHLCSISPRAGSPAATQPPPSAHPAAAWPALRLRVPCPARSIPKAVRAGAFFVSITSMVARASLGRGLTGEATVRAARILEEEGARRCARRWLAVARGHRHHQVAFGDKEGRARDQARGRDHRPGPDLGPCRSGGLGAGRCRDGGGTAACAQPRGSLADRLATTAGAPMPVSAVPRTVLLIAPSTPCDLSGSPLGQSMTVVGSVPQSLSPARRRPPVVQAVL